MKPLRYENTRSRIDEKVSAQLTYFDQQLRTKLERGLIKYSNNTYHTTARAKTSAESSCSRFHVWECIIIRCISKTSQKYELKFCVSTKSKYSIKSSIYLGENCAEPGVIELFNWGSIGALLDLFKKPGLSTSIVEEQLFPGWSVICIRSQSYNMDS